MIEERSLTIQESSALVFALALSRSASYSRAVELHEKAVEMENESKSGYLALDNEAEQHEIYADVYDSLIEFICEGRLIIRAKEGEK